MWRLKYTNWKPHPKHRRRPPEEDDNRHIYMQEGAVAVINMYYLPIIYTQWCPLPGGFYLPLQPGGLYHWLHCCQQSEFTGTIDDIRSLPNLWPRSAHHHLTTHHTDHHNPEPDTVSPPHHRYHAHITRAPPNTTTTVGDPRLASTGSESM
jgi:hypothetical protein